MARVSQSQGRAGSVLFYNLFRGFTGTLKKATVKGVSSEGINGGCLSIRFEIPYRRRLKRSSRG